MAVYDTSLHHILDELERLDLLIRVQVARARQQHREDQTQPTLSALYISEEEVDGLLQRPAGEPVWAATPLPADVQQAAQTRLDQMAADIAERVDQSLRQGAFLRLAALAHLFDLTTFEVDVVLVCLAPELDRRYERLYAYLHDDLTRRAPTVDLVLNLLCPDVRAKTAAQAAFGAIAPLIQHGIVRLHDDVHTGSISLLSKAVQLEPRVARFLLNDDALDERLRPHARLLAPVADLDIDTLIFPDAFKQQVEALFAHAQTGGGADMIVYCQGGYGVGKKSTALACGRALGAPLLVVNGKHLAALKLDEFETLARAIGREARLQGALLYWEGFDALLNDDKAAHLALALPMLGAHLGPTFLTGEAAWVPTDVWRDVAFVRLVFSQPGYDERLRLWQRALADDFQESDPSKESDSYLTGVAGKFRLCGGQIRDAAATAHNLALARDPTAPQVTEADLHAACRLHSNRKLAELALHITPHYDWDDLVLPDDQMAQLREVFNQTRYRAVVYDAWGFDRKLAMGKGLNVLFAGPPGTGKTMAADVLAGALGLDLYKIDLSGIVSKYIGETEKNLSRIFAEAAASNAILFFDEADALFGKRTAVQDAHDRYANVEISYLLQKMEEYEGMVILATNLRKNLDEAFVRRLHATIDFPMPDVEHRRRIWAQIWPEATPRDPALDLEFMAQRVEVAGGSIRNIALASAFLAASNGGVVTMQHLIHATQREYQKMGKVLTAGEFGAHAR